MTTVITAVSQPPKVLNSPFRIRRDWTDHPTCNLHLLPPQRGQRATSTATDLQPGGAAGFILRYVLLFEKVFFGMYRPSVQFLCLPLMG